MPKVPSTGDIELTFAARQARCRHRSQSPWLFFSCPARGEFGSVDLRKLDPVDFVPPVLAECTVREARNVDR